MTVDYLDILIQFSMHVIQIGGVLFVGESYSEYETDTAYSSWGESSDHESEKHVRAGGEVVVWSQRIEKMNLFGFDQILALSRSSVSSHFFNLHRHASSVTSGAETALVHWSSDQFSAEFNPISVHFLSSGRAVVLINISSGGMAVKKETETTTFWRWGEWSRPGHSEITERIDFGDVTVAFEVDLELKHHGELAVHDHWHKSFEGSFIYKHRHAHEHVFKHLLLNFHRPKYVDSLSNVAALGKGRDSPYRLDTLLHYMKDYLFELAESGYNIIHSVPIFTNHDERSFGYTSVAHKVISKSNVTVDNCRYVLTKDAPILLILGMSNFRPMPPLFVEWFAGWIIENKRHKSFGTLCLSKTAFLEGRLLSLLSEVNALTTVVPKFAGILDGQWHFELTNWKDDPYRQHRPCTWKERRNVSSNHLEYVWEHRDEWNYEHEGTASEEKKCEYTLACHTRNHLHIPTIFRPNSLEIKLTGESYLKVRGRTDTASWSKSTSAKWSASIIIHSRASGLTVEVSGQTHPVFADEDCDGHCDIDVSALHAKHLPRNVNLGHVLESLKRTLEGGWEFAAPGGESYGLTNPVFTRQGDLIVQLCEHKVSSVIHPTLTPAVSYSNVVKTYAHLGTHTHASATTVAELVSHNGHAKITLPSPAPPGLDRDFNLSTTTLDSPALKTPSTPPLEVSASMFSPKSTKNKSNGKTVKVDSAKIETIPITLPSNAGLDMK
ncbi:hypothetical protein QCA50_001483 [Cerrena zonata]|uniref:Uncharacterized protein n=1 Tax=Cerrena zonata TaxID=2478898 RepID=A0AAW0GNG7_9APHY